jgi:organic hydroperoxide reductase OsmC/OhrA
VLRDSTTSRRFRLADEVGRSERQQNNENAQAIQDVRPPGTTSFAQPTTVTATVGIGAIAQGFGLEVELQIELTGLSERESELLIHKAHVVCPYSNATRDNIAVRLGLVSSRT